MSDREAQSLGRILALVLRHAPEKFGVDMDMFPKIFSVYNHCLEKDSCKKSHPDIYKP